MSNWTSENGRIEHFLGFSKYQNFLNETNYIIQFYGERKYLSMNITNFLTPFFIFKNQNVKKTHLKRSNYRFFDFLYSGPTLNALCLNFFRSRKIDLHSEIPRVVTKMSKMLPFVTSCNRNVTIFFPKKWIFLGARYVGNLKMGRKK